MSLRSMTGFGTASAPWVTPEGPGTVDVELRTVNARFLEIKLRQPFGPAVEQQLRLQLGQRLGRGRADVTVALRGGTGSHAETPDPHDADHALRGLGIDPARVDAALSAIAEVIRRVPATLEVSPVNPSELLRFLAASARPSAHESVAAPPPFLAAVVDEALDALVAFRVREGTALAGAVTTLAGDLQSQIEALAGTLPAEGERLATKLRERIAELTHRLAGEAVGTVLDPERLAQEVAQLVTRGDVTEELDRISSHLNQLHEVVGADASFGQGKTLEFVAQELFREITTIGSKITSHAGSRIVIEAKGTIERIREQVHNVE